MTRMSQAGWLTCLIFRALWFRHPPGRSNTAICSFHCCDRKLSCSWGLCGLEQGQEQGHLMSCQAKGTSSLSVLNWGCLISLLHAASVPTSCRSWKQQKNAHFHFWVVFYISSSSSVALGKGKMEARTSTRKGKGKGEGGGKGTDSWFEVQSNFPWLGNLSYG